MKPYVFKGPTHRVQLKIFDFTTEDTPPAQREKRPKFCVTVLPNSANANTAFSRGTQVYYGDQGKIASSTLYNYSGVLIGEMPEPLRKFISKWWFSGPKYKTNIISTSGAWREGNGGATLKEAIQNAYLQSLQPHIRIVSVSRRGKGRMEGIYHMVGVISAYDGRVFMARSGDLLTDFCWKGSTRLVIPVLRGGVVWSFPFSEEAPNVRRPWSED